MSLANENLRYLLWKSGIEHENWITELAKWLNCSESRAEKLLDNEPLQHWEQQLIADNKEVSEEAIQTERLLGDDVNILQENIRFLIDKEISGLNQKELAARIKIKDVTLSRWKTGAHIPESTKLLNICNYFNLPVGTNLKEDPIFLSLTPIGDLSRKRWLIKMIDSLDSRALNEIFPFLQRLLKEK